jgi:hypothetical protein
MSNPNLAPNDSTAESEESTSLVFAQMVLQHSNLALIFLGKTPNPQTGQMTQDLDNARFLIDQLEMLAVKTRGNLAPHEDALLKQTLTGLRMAFVDAVSNPKAPPAADVAASSGPAPETPKPAEPPPAAEPTPSGESHKKFTKKY